MPTVTLADLLTPITESEAQQTQLDVLAIAGFPVTSWEPTSVGRLHTKADGRVLSELSLVINKIAAGGFLDLAEGDFLDLLLESNFRETRRAGVFTQRVLRITDTGGAPYTITIGQLVAVHPNGLQYRNTTAGTLTVSGFIDIIFQAESPGIAYNAIAVGAWALATPLPGTTIVDGPSGIVQLGSDEETDSVYRQRGVDKWGSLGAGANDSAYRYHARTASNQVVRVKVREQFPLDGQVTIYIASSSGVGTNLMNVFPPGANGAVTQTGAGPTVTITGTPQINVNGLVEILTGGIIGVSTFRYSIDGGLTFSGSITTAATFLIPTTGVTINFSAGTYVATTSYAWASTASVVTIVQNYIDPASHLGKAPNAIDAFVVSAFYEEIAVSGSGSYFGTSPLAPSQAAQALSDLSASLDIGATVYLSQLIETIMAVEGVRNISITSPGADFPLDPGAVSSILFGVFSWTAV